MKKLLLTAALLIGTAAPAMAQSACTAPAQPTPADGATATRDQMVAYHNAVNAFISQSDVYQKCLQDDMDAQTAAAQKSKTTANLKPDTDAAQDSQNAKVAVAAKYQDVLKAFRAQTPPAK